MEACDEQCSNLKCHVCMNTRRKFAVLTLLFALMTALACQKTDLPDPESGRTDKEARSALPDTIPAPDTTKVSVPDTTSVPGNPSEPGEEHNVPPSDTASVPEIPQKPAPLSLADEKFLVRAVTSDSLKGRGVFLIFSSERNLGCTGANYISYNYISHETKEEADTGFEIRIGDLIFVNECDQPGSPATVSILVSLLKGTETMFSVHIGGKKYQGKIMRSDGRLLIEWPDESQFKFSGKVVLNL